MAWRVDPRRSSHVGPGVDYGYGGPGSTMAAPAEPTTLLSQRAGRRHSLGMHGRPKPTRLVTWCHIIARTGQATAMCRHMTAFAATTMHFGADELQGAAMSVPATPIPFLRVTLTPAFSTPTTSPNVAHPATTVH